MSFNEDPPFGLGQTLGVSSASDGVGWVGAKKEFPDVHPVTGVIRSNRVKTCIATRNTSGAALLPKRVGTFLAGSGPAIFGAISGYSSVSNQEFVGVIDEYLPAAGVAALDIFWTVVDGPTEMLVALSGSDVAAGDRLVAITAITSGATTAGRVTPFTTIAATSNLGSALVGIIAYAASAATTANSVLAFVCTKLK